MKLHNIKNDFPTLIQDFFIRHLVAQKNASPQTIASYRDTFRLLLRFTQKRMKKPPSRLHLQDIDAPLVLSFLDYLEKTRGNSIRTRNARLAAIRSFVHYVSLQELTYLPNAQRILAIPLKRFDRPLLGFLSKKEMNAVINAPDRSTWSGHRDQVMFTTFYNTGARVSELIGLSISDVSSNGETYIRIHGKGRKDRAIPLWKSTTKQLKKWINRIDANNASPIFCNRMGNYMTRSGVEHRLRVAVDKAAEICPSLKDKKVTPHTIRHTTAMHLLQSGVDMTTIALWLGHENLSTTHIYIEIDLEMKKDALGKLQEPQTKSGRYSPSDSILDFLENL